MSAPCAFLTCKGDRCDRKTTNKRWKKSDKQPGITRQYYACADHNTGPYNENLAIASKPLASSRATPAPSASYKQVHYVGVDEIQSKFEQSRLNDTAPTPVHRVAPTPVHLNDLDEDDLRQILADKKAAKKRELLREIAAIDA